MTRLLLLRLLLLSVFFNTAIGLPAHEAKHLSNVGGWVAGWHAEDNDGEAPDEALHELCGWCHAHAQAFVPAGAPPVSPLFAVGTDRFAAPASDALVRSARPWAFASRDPPRA